MRLVWPVVVASLACGARPAPRPVIANTVPEPAAQSEVRGKVSDARTGEALPGVTVIFGAGDGSVAITDENGAYRVTVPNGRYVLHVYYLDFAIERDISVWGPVTIDQQLDQRWAGRTGTVRCRSASAKTCVPSKESAP
ncbi:MAG: carboxypeptidase-like regulatory domain-containing protein [Deltaproteobacteria bacterium]|nr:carboxypeptidase-like regulatory domain-containing protein [Deltaproteobacteria bacterium]